MSNSPEHKTPQAWQRLRSSINQTMDASRYSAGLLLRHAPLASILLILGNLITGLATPIIVWSMNGLVTVISEDLVDPWVQVLPWLAVLSGALILRSAEGAFTEYLASIIRQRVDGAIYRDVTEKAIRVPLASFESREYYHKLETGRRAIKGHLVYVLDALAALIAATAGVVGLLVLFAQAHWLLAVVLIATVIVVSFVEARQSSRYTQVNYGSSPLRQEIAYWGGLLSNHRTAAELRVFQLGQPFLKRWRHAFDRYVTEMNQARFRLAVGGFVTGVVQEVVRWVTTVSILVLTMLQVISVGSMVALLYGVGRFRELVGAFSWTVAELVEHWSELQHLRAFLELPDEGISRGKLPAPRPIQLGVTFEEVSFTYPGSDRPALSNITLTLRPDERIALVGENGAGKSTLVRLLLGLYQPTNGHIKVDGSELNQIDPALWRREASVVFQSFMRYPATVRENIGYGDVDLLTAGGAGAHPRIVAAARKSGADGFVQQLPSGYDTLLGKQFEGGTELSTGQWQRLALARAHVRDAQIMVLDEPTAALDPKAEVEVYRQFQAASEGRCTVFISHRLGSARLADRILVLKDGQLMESGSHDELIAQNGEYARMYRLQATWYTDEGEVAIG